MAAAPGKPQAGKGKITKAEERAKGRVKREVYLAYFFAWGPYLLFPTLVLSMALLERGLQVGQNAWLAVWSDATQVDGSWAYVRYYLAVYALLGVSSLGLQGVKAVFLIQGSINSSRTLHANILEKLFRLPMSFFESQPTGRLLNRFTNDTEKVDTAISSSLNSALACVVSAACSVAVVVAVTPTVVVALAPVGYLYYRVQALFIAAQREIKRLDSLAMSPIFGLFAESLRGVATIRAFGFQDSLRAKNFGEFPDNGEEFVCSVTDLDSPNLTRARQCVQPGVLAARVLQPLAVGAVGVRGGADCVRHGHDGGHPDPPRAGPRRARHHLRPQPHGPHGLDGAADHRAGGQHEQR